MLSVSLSYLGQALISFQTTLALSNISEDGEALVDPGEERDEVIRTSEGIRLILCDTLVKVGLLIRINKRCAARLCV